jgi:hypothetical protein
MPRNFKELQAQMAPKRVARAELKAKEIMTDMLLAEIGGWHGVGPSKTP